MYSGVKTLSTLNADVLGWKKNVAKVVQVFMRLLLEKIIHTKCCARLNELKIVLI